MIYRSLLKRENDALFSVAHSLPRAMSKKKVPKKKDLTLASDQRDVPLDERKFAASLRLKNLDLHFSVK